MSGISKSQVSRLCGEIDGKIQGFLERPLEGHCPYLWLDATYVKLRESGPIVSVAVTMAMGVNDYCDPMLSGFVSRSIWLVASASFLRPSDVFLLVLP